MNIILIGIIACEIGFWVVLSLGLLLRYLVKMRRASRLVLLCVPLLDVALLALITYDMIINRSVAEFSHGLGAVYLGFTVAFGRQIIASADAWFSHRFAGGPAPVKTPIRGKQRVVYEWKQWLRMLLCAAIVCVVLGVMILAVQDPARTGELKVWFARVGLVTGVWLVGWPVWESVRWLGTHLVGSSRPRE